MRPIFFSGGGAPRKPASRSIRPTAATPHPKDPADRPTPPQQPVGPLPATDQEWAKPEIARLYNLKDYNATLENRRDAGALPVWRYCLSACAFSELSSTSAPEKNIGRIS